MAVPLAWRRVQHAQRAAAARLRRIQLRAAQTAVDPIASARFAGLHYVNDETTPGIRRLGSSKRFRYLDPHRRTVSSPAELQRIRALAIPPAWTDVWICCDPDGHIQATGRDARGRKQYRYHPRWRETRDSVKYNRLLAFARALCRIRARTEADLKRSGLPREKVLATVVRLLEKTLIRVGNEEYARLNGSVGLTTMRDRHAKVAGSKVRFEFRGKSGIEHTVDLRDRRLARIVKACQDLPGQELFQYVDEDGSRQMIGSTDVNAYLREITGEDFTAKDFRTWAGTVLAARALVATPFARSKAEAKRHIVKAVEAVAARLGNTKAVCRKSYIHPAVFDAYAEGTTIARLKRTAARKVTSSGLDEEEAAVAALIRHRLRLAS